MADQELRTAERTAAAEDTPEARYQSARVAGRADGHLWGTVVGDWRLSVEHPHNVRTTTATQEEDGILMSTHNSHRVEFAMEACVSCGQMRRRMEGLPWVEF